MDEMALIRQRMEMAQARGDADVLMARLPPEVKTVTRGKRAKRQGATPPPLPVAPKALPELPPVVPMVAAAPHLRNYAGQIGARDVRKLLQPSAIRSQIILNEVLQPPLSLRDN